MSNAVPQKAKPVDRLYDFEARDSKFFTVRDPAKLRADAEEFIRRLSEPNDPTSFLANLDKDSEERKSIYGYVLHNHRAIKWYQDKREAIGRQRVAFAVLSILLLAVTPILIFYATKLFSNGTTDSTGTTGSTELLLSQATALIGGLMAAQRAISAWLQKTFSAANFMGAASSLKAKIYAFESDWQGKAFDPSSGQLMKDCHLALEVGVREARDIVTKQRNDYFAANAPPNVDIATSLIKASKDTSSLLSSYQTPELRDALAEEKSAKTRLEKASKLEQEIKELVEQNKLLDHEIQTKEQQHLAENDAGKKAALKSRLTNLTKTRDGNEDQLIKKRGSIAAMG